MFRTAVCVFQLLLVAVPGNDAHPVALRLGEIQHQAVALLPLPRDREEFGIGEEVDFWIDVEPDQEPAVLPAATQRTSLLPGDAGEVMWVVDFATAYPIVGTHTRVTLDVRDKDAQSQIGVRVIVPDRLQNSGRIAANSSILPIVSSAKPIWPWSRDTGHGPFAGTVLHLASWQAAVALSGWLTSDQSDVSPANAAFSSALNELDDLRHGMQTPSKLVALVGQALLDKYQEPQERGQIHCEVAHVFAQGGMQEPDAVIAHAKAALELPIPDEQRLQMHVYWGDALRLRPSEEEFAARRKAAAEVYLKGLNLLADYKLPERAPEPANEIAIGGAIDDAQKERNERIMAARQQVKFTAARVLDRDVVSRQIVDIYSRTPLARDELKELASTHLQDPQAAGTLLASLDNRIAAAVPVVGQVAPTGGGVEDDGSGPVTAAVVFVTAIILVVVMAFFVYGLRRSVGRK